ncbi:MAG TPA: TonB-dependent receptor [Granulicella sp.]
MNLLHARLSAGRCRLVRIWVFLFALCIASFHLSAQQFEGSVTGTVKDSSGAILRSASVTATNTQTRVVFTSTTNTDGLYSIQLLPIGSYDLSIEASGFEKQLQHFELHGNDHLQVDAALHPGSEGTTVNVQSEIPQLETTTGDSGLTVSAEQVHDLPTLGRNTFALATLTPGVTVQQGQPANVSQRPFDNGGYDYLTVNGGRPFTAEVTIDGLANTADEQASVTQISNVNFVPAPDMTSEFRVQSSVYDAQYGRTGGGIISMNLKSGTNQFHGVLYDYIRNSALNANDYADNRAGHKKASFHWSQPGLEIDGPVYIPKLYDGRNRTFFMFGWEEVRTTTPNPVYSTVPTALERAGDFSQSLAGGKPAAIYDPLTTVPNGSGYSRTAFQNSVIPANRINPIAAKIISLLPAPNVPGAGNSNNLFAGPNNDGDAYDAFAYRVDHSVNPAHRLSFVYLYSDRHETRGGSGFPKAITPDYEHYRINYGAHVTWNWIMTPSLISSFGIGWNEHRFALMNQQEDYDLSSLGFPSYFANSPAPNLFPRLNISGYSSFGNANSGTGSFNTSDTYDLRETLIKTFRRHNLNFGGEVRQMRDNRSLAAGNSSFSFGRDFTQANPLSGDAVSGSGFASFLLGYADGGSMSQSPRFAYRDVYYAAFVQDSWRINDRLTLTLGLRWDTETPLRDAKGQQNTGFDPNAAYSFAGIALKGQVQFNGNHNPYNYDFNNFGPRVGFAYRPSSSFVVRGGYGVLYSPIFDPPSSTGFTASTSYIASNNNLLTPALPVSLSNPYPSGFVSPAGASSNLNGQGGWNYWDKNSWKIPQTQQYSMGFEMQLPHRTVFDMHYVGQITRNLQNSRNQNFTSLTNLALGNALNTQVANPFAGLLPGTSLNSATMTLQQSLLPYPQYTSFSKLVANGVSKYNGLQVRLEKRISDGLQFQVGYTWSKNMIQGYLNDQDTGLWNWIDPLGIPHVLTISAGYQLPFFAHTEHRLVRQTLGGWATNLVLTAMSGKVYGVPGGVQATGLNPRIQNPTRTHTFNTCTITTSGTLQNCANESQPAWSINKPFTLNLLNPYFAEFRSSIPTSVNFSIFKTFPIHDSINLQFRAEAFNLTNTPQFGGPDTGVNSATFGQLTNFAQSNIPRNIQIALKLHF